MSDESTNLVPATDKNALLDSWGFGSAGSRFLTSIQGSTPKDNAAKLQMLNQDGMPISDFIGKELHIVAYLCRPAKKADRQTGEIINLLLIQMLTDKGETISSFSEFVLRGLLDTASLFGEPSHTNPFKLIPRTRGKPPQQSHYLDTSPMTSPLVNPQRKDK